MTAFTASSGDSLEAVRAAVGLQYTVDRLLGQGGMGAVYVGRDITLDRPVAIKVIKPDVAADDVMRHRFLQEARSVAKLRHPNIVSVYSAGEASGLLYFVMELVEGQSLRELMETSRGRVPHNQSQRIVAEIAVALDHAHSHGLVHRDVKPENVLIESSTGKALLTDFGVARVVHAEAEDGLTQTGVIIGSPRYMSPEQLSGDGRIDGRADLYALALIGYELYAGAPVVANGTIAAMIYKHMSEVPRPLASAAPGTPTHVAAAIDRGLEKDPNKRWQSGAEFSAGIRGETPSAPLAGKTSNRGRIAFTAAVVAAVVTVGVWMSVREPSVKGDSYLVAPFEIQSADQSIGWLREGAVNMLTLTLGQWSDLKVVDYERTLSVIDAANLGAKPRLSADDAFVLARLARASRVVMGQVLATADSLIVVAKLYDVRSKTSDQQTQASIAKGADPRPLFDQLGQQLLNIGGFRGTSTVQLAAATTSNLAAYRSFLAGVKLLNSWRLPEADREFTNAIRLDSTFALAYHKRALGLGWSQTGSPEYIYTSTRAFDLSSRLPPRERSLVAGHHYLALALNQSNSDTAATRRNFDESIKAYHDLIDPPRGDSLVAEGWYGLADANYHAAQNTPLEQDRRHLTASLRGFNKTLAIDSTYHLAYSHLVQLYMINTAAGSVFLIDGDSAIIRDSATVRRLGTRIDAVRAEGTKRAIATGKAWTRADEGSQHPFVQLAQAYVTAGFPDSAVRTLRQGLSKPRSNGPLARLSLLGLEETADDTGAVNTMRYVVDRFAPDTLREMSAWQRFQLIPALMSSSAMRGRAADVDKTAKLYYATDSMMPGSNRSSAPMIEFFRTGLRLAMGDSMTPGYRRTVLSASAWIDPMPENLRTSVRSGSVSVPYVAFLVTHDSIFRNMARDWDRRAHPELDAIVALGRGDTAAATALAKSFPLPDSLRKARFIMGGMRSVARAEVLEQLGLVRQAAETYEATTMDRINRNGVIEPGFAVWVRSFAARARLWATLGEREKAIAAYEEFLRRWKDADGASAKLVDQARQELARLRDSRVTR